MGPKLFIVSPGIPARLSLVEIGQNFPVEIGRFPDFKLFFSDSPHPTTCLGWKSTQQGFSVDFIYFFFERNSNFARKRGAVIGWYQVWKLGDPPVSRDLVFWMKYCKISIPHVKLHAIGYIWSFFFLIIQWILEIEDRHSSGIVSDVLHLFHVYVLTFIFFCLHSALCSRVQKFRFWNASKLESLKLHFRNLADCYMYLAQKCLF